MPPWVVAHAHAQALRDDNNSSSTRKYCGLLQPTHTAPARPCMALLTPSHRLHAPLLVAAIWHSLFMDTTQTFWRTTLTLARRMRLRLVSDVFSSVNICQHFRSRFSTSISSYEWLLGATNYFLNHTGRMDIDEKVLNITCGIQMKTSIAPRLFFDKVAPRVQSRITQCKQTKTLLPKGCFQTYKTCTW